MQSILFAFFVAASACNNHQQPRIHEQTAIATMENVQKHLKKHRTSKAVQIYDEAHSYEFQTIYLAGCSQRCNELYEQSGQLEQATLTTTVTKIQKSLKEFNQHHCDKNPFLQNIDIQLFHAELEPKVKNSEKKV